MSDKCPNCARLEAERDSLRRQVVNLATQNELLLREQGKNLFEDIKKAGFKNVDEDDSPLSRALRKAGLGGSDEPTHEVREEEQFDPTKAWQNVTHLFNPETRVTYCGIKMDEQADGKWRDGQPSELSVSPCRACIKARMSHDEDGGSEGISSWKGSY